VRDAFGGAAIEVAIVLGSGLGDAVRVDGEAVPYAELPGIPVPGVAGHAGIARVGTCAGRRVVAFAGRHHLYAGHSPREATALVRLAAAAGARTIVLTNAAGGLDPTLRAGDLVAIDDHLNLTGATPLHFATDGFLDLTDAYAPRLRALVRDRASAFVRRGGIYAGVRGPAYETPAEARMLRALGADLVGMSTVLETIAARACGLEVLGLALVTNVHGGGEALAHTDVLAAARRGADALARTLDAILPAA